MLPSGLHVTMRRNLLLWLLVKHVCGFLCVSAFIFCACACVRVCINPQRGGSFGTRAGTKSGRCRYVSLTLILGGRNSAGGGCEQRVILVKLTRDPGVGEGGEAEGSLSQADTGPGGRAGGAEILTRVTKRSVDRPSPYRINTSEYFEQIFLDSRYQQPRVRPSLLERANQHQSGCFWDHEFRSRSSF